MAIANPLEPFLWGSGGQQMTPAQIARQREVAALLAQGIGDTSPVDHWLQGVPRLVNALGAGLRESRADAAEQAGRDAYQEKWDQVFGGGSTSPVAVALAEPATAAQATEEIGNGFLASLISSESGGNWAASNDEIGAGGAPGHFGRLQFGQARLQDAKNAGIMPASMTPEQFMASPEAQQSVEAWHFADIDKQAQDLGLTSYVGQTVGGAPITMDAIRAMAHLGGIGGAQQFLESGGAYNPEDAYGTSLLDYALQHGGAGGGAPRTQVAQADMASLLGLASDPFASDAQKQIVMSLIGQQMEQPDSQGLINAGNGNIYNPNTGEWITAPTSGTPEAPDLEELYDPETGMPYKARWNPETGEYERVGGIKAPSGTTLSVDPATGAVTFTQGTGAGQKLTEAQGKDIGFYTRGIEANSQLDIVENNLTDFLQQNTDLVPLGLGNYLRTPEFRQAKVAADNFLAAVLRKDTGAAITPAEFDLYGPMFLPIPGDDPATLQQKRRMRDVAMMAIESGLGTADTLAQANRVALGLEPTITPRPESLQGDDAPAAPEARQSQANPDVFGAGEIAPPVVPTLPEAGASDQPSPDGVDPAVWAVMTPEERALWQ